MRIAGISLSFLNVVNRRKSASAVAGTAPEFGRVLKPYCDYDNPSSRRLKTFLLAAVLGYCFLSGFGFALIGQYLPVVFLMPIAALAMAVIWALPDSRKAPIDTLWAWVVAFVVCLVVWPNYIALALPGLPWITMARLTGFPLTAVLLVCVSTSKTLRSRIATAVRASPLVWKLLVGFVLISATSVIYSIRPTFSADKFILAQITWTALFFTGVYVFLTPGRVVKMAAILWAMALVVGAIGVWEWRAQHVLWAGHIPSFLQIDDPSVSATLEGNRRTGQWGVYRVVSTFSTPLGLGEYMAIVMPIIMQFAMGRFGWAVRVAAWLSALFALFVAQISGSRLGMVGSLLAIVFYIGIWASLKWRRERQSILPPFIVISYPTLTMIGVVAISSIGRLRHIVWGDGSQGFSDQGRMDQWSMGWPKILSRPIGYGFGMAGDALGYSSPGGFLTIDSYYLSVLMEIGIVGFVFYYGMFAASIFYMANSIYRFRLKTLELEFIIALMISLLNFLIIKSVFSQQDNHPLVFLILGMSVALIYRVTTGDPGVAPGRTGLSAVAGVRV